MGRTVRRVPADWQHPVDANGDFIPLLENFMGAHADWIETHVHWEQGERENFFSVGWVPRTGDELQMTEEDWHGQEPQPKDFMPEWPDSHRTHWQMYEDTTEGTPISPVCATPEELATWLVAHQASFFADQTTTYEHWLGIITGNAIGSPIFRIGEG